MLDGKKETTTVIGDNLSLDTYQVEYKMFGKIKVSIPYSSKLINVLKINNIDYKLIKNV